MAYRFRERGNSPADPFFWMIAAHVEMKIGSLSEKLHVEIQAVVILNQLGFLILSNE